jgi:hypothetical protein
MFFTRASSQKLEKLIQEDLQARKKFKKTLITPVLTSFEGEASPQS